MLCSHSAKYNHPTFSAGGSHCAHAPGWPRAEGKTPAGLTDPRVRPPGPPLVPRPFLFSQIPRDTGIPVLFLNPSLRGSGREEEELATREAWLPLPCPCLHGGGLSPVSLPHCSLILRHEALRRLALPNFCLKLNSKEEGDTEKQDLFCGTFHLPRAQGGAGRASPEPARSSWEKGEDGDSDLRPAAYSFLSAETKPQADSAQQPLLSTPG